MKKYEEKDTNRNFFSDVFDVVKLIPSGRVTSYGAIAKYLGMASGARLVGWAMNASHLETNVPAHRVVNSQGLLTGKHHFASLSTMQKRLEEEGIRIVKDKVQGFEKRFWDPSQELI